MHEIAILLENHKKTDALVKILNEFAEKKSFTGEDIANSLTDLNQNQKRPLIFLLKSIGVFTTINTALSIFDYHLKVNKKALSDFESKIYNIVSATSKASKSIGRMDSAKVRITATMPEIFYKNGSPPKIPSVSSMMAKLITQAENEIWIVNPFFDEYAVAHLIGYLNDAANRNVKIKIITRPTFKDEGQKASIDLIRKSIDKPENLALKTFFTKDEQNWYSVHSKILLVDRNQCYIGSANITEGSFTNNFELGVIITGKSVIETYEIIKGLWEMSK